MAEQTTAAPVAPVRRSNAGIVNRVPPQSYFLLSAIFHYLGPAFAVLLFAQVGVLGVAWLRIASAAVIFTLWRRPWRLFIASGWPLRWLLIGLGATLALMNACFYLAIAHLPLSTVGAIEFLGPIALATAGVRSGRNFFALACAAVGGFLLTDIRIAGQPLGFVFAFANCALFMLYIVLGHRIARDGGGAGIERLGAAMLVAALVITPIGFSQVIPALTQPILLLAGIGVGVCSSVIPYITDQLAMARLPQATFALLLSLLPAFATLIGAIVLRQFPAPIELGGIALVICGVALHKELQAH